MAAPGGRTGPGAYSSCAGSETARQHRKVMRFLKEYATTEDQRAQDPAGSPSWSPMLNVDGVEKNQRRNAQRGSQPRLALAVSAGDAPSCRPCTSGSGPDHGSYELHPTDQTPSFVEAMGEAAPAARGRCLQRRDCRGRTAARMMRIYARPVFNYRDPVSPAATSREGGVPRSGGDATGRDLARTSDQVHYAAILRRRGIWQDTS